MNDIIFERVQDRNSMTCDKCGQKHIPVTVFHVKPSLTSAGAIAFPKVQRGMMPQPLMISLALCVRCLALAIATATDWKTVELIDRYLEIGLTDRYPRNHKTDEPHPSKTKSPDTKTKTRRPKK